MKLKIIDLFAGIGGIRLGFEKAAKKKLIETNAFQLYTLDCFNFMW